MTVELHDPSWVGQSGLEIRFFYNDESQFPKVTSTGDIVILYNIKKLNSQRGQMMISNAATRWAILEHKSVRDDKSPDGSDIIVHLPSKASIRGSSPAVAVLRYAKYILSLENPDNWRRPLCSSQDASSGQRIQAIADQRQKFTLISDVVVPRGKKGIFGDLLCEVRRIWDPKTGDRYNQRLEQINVQIVKRTASEKDEKFKAFLRRRREYEDHCRQEGITFIRDPGTTRRPNKEQRENNESMVSNPNEAGTGTNKQPTPRMPITNDAIRCNNVAIPITPIATILSPDTLKRSTPSGNTYHLPFQNCCYKSRIRVVDFFPDNLEDFCAPVRESEYACLSDGESVSDVDLTQEGISASRDDDGVKWEWRFILLVEDAKPTPTADGRVKQMELHVYGPDGDFLLREDPCNLRENRKALVKLKEKLFHLWGDLQEQKEEMKSSGNQGPELAPKGRPFECFIKEYAVPAEDEMRKEDKEVERWERLWRLCMTTIVSE
ncbi:hypothetical protein DV738_g4754, partial [Chaetothyriales sp. CBS 135597]